MAEQKPGEQTLTGLLYISDTDNSGAQAYPLLSSLIVIHLAFLADESSPEGIAGYWNSHLQELRDLMPELPLQPVSAALICSMLKLLKTDKYEDCLRLQILSVAKQQNADIAPDSEDNKAEDDTGLLQYAPAAHTSDLCRHISIMARLNTSCRYESEYDLSFSEYYELQYLFSKIHCADCVFAGYIPEYVRPFASEAINKDAEYCLIVPQKPARLEPAVDAAFADEDLLDMYAREFSTQSLNLTALPASVIKKAVLGPWAYDAETLLQLTLHQDGTTARWLFISSLSADNPDIMPVLAEICSCSLPDNDSQNPVLHMFFPQDGGIFRNGNLLSNRNHLQQRAEEILKAAQKALTKGKEKPSLKRLKLTAQRRPDKAFAMLLQLAEIIRRENQRVQDIPLTLGNKKL